MALQQQTHRDGIIHKTGLICDALVNKRHRKEVVSLCRLLS